MSLSFDGDGQTPLSEEDLDGLRPTWVTTRSDLNEVERVNIGAARRRWMTRRSGTIVDDLALRRLHADMFGDVWHWAGRYRSRETSIGIDPVRIATALRDLIGDVEHWDGRSAIARFHHRLVSIHAFPNGNGRHGRLAADLLALQRGVDVPGWSVDRGAYLAALRHADATDDLHPLVVFMWGNRNG